MAFSILIYEQDQDIFAALKKRLSIRFPEAYIMQAEIGTDEDDQIFSKCVIRLYDSTTYSADMFGHEAVSSGIINICPGSSKIIDCKDISDRIFELYNNNQSLPSHTGTSRSRFRLLIPFAYINERELFIKQEMNRTGDLADMTVRIDLMSGIRMPGAYLMGQARGSLSELLKHCSDKNFRPEDILKYLSPDISGCLCPGKPDLPDDVFDIGIGSVINLLKNLRELTDMGDPDLDALVVAEGFRTDDLKEICKCFDGADILLPSRMCAENSGNDLLIGKLAESLSPEYDFRIHYIDELAEHKEYINNERRI